MKKNNIIKGLFLAVIISFTACTDDLNRYPTNDLTPDKVYSNFEGYQEVMAKVYGSYALTGNNGPAGSADVVGIDEGNYADFVRGFFNLQCLTTEEAICAWGDTGIPDLNYMTWASNNFFIKGFYYRCVFQVKMASEFIKEASDSKLSERGFSEADMNKIRQFRHEARFLRAYSYWVLMDIFGNPPFVDENTPTGKYLPPQIQRADLFKYIETELLAIEPLMVEARQNEYGRADKAAVWSLLARMYLNAKTYIGQEKYTEAITYSGKVINAGYSLKPSYEQLFFADNDKNNPEVILSINYDGLHSKNFAGTTYLVNSAFKASREDAPDNYAAIYGSNSGGWGGNRSRPSLPALFENGDSRNLFYGGNSDVTSVGEFTDGLSVKKFRNVKVDGTPGSNIAEGFADIDFPMFRLSEMYLIYAEAVLRGGTSGNQETAVSYMNLIRQRAFGNSSKNFTSLTLDDILSERGRELYWEGFRRTDLIRYGKYTSVSYLWQWKGGVKNGQGVNDKYNIFPIPSDDINANPGLVQNPGY